MTHSIEKTTEYEKLIEDLRELIETGRLRAVQAVSEVFIQTNWQLGRRIGQAVEIQVPDESPGFIGRLSADLEVSPAALYRALQFYRAYPEGLPATPEIARLGWSAHVDLLSVKDPEALRFYTQLAFEQDWSRATLRKAIRANLFAVEKAKGEGHRASIERPQSGLHTYLAIVERVIDGDTLEARVDLGFDVWRVEHIRLRGLDAPELRTPEGQAAKRFVARELADVPFVVLRTYKTDKYARYVADVFYSTEAKKKELVFEKGTFLNQQLLDNGHAERMYY
ncbi:MAG: thermonuclease family protein [Deltaproteobacteria bacterium]|nr:thermonuclease family protein [Deltaproteobacteria bacterium]MBW1871454.1 thermonuclease family protein [Deltaproteobacteria bacterium]